MTRATDLGWLLVLTTPFVLCLVPDAAAYLAYDRTAVNSGQTWKLFTGSFSHLNAYHAALNVYSMVLLVMLFGVRRKPHALGAFLLLCVLVFLSEHLLGTNAWARGMSGAGYGFAVFGALVYLNRAGALLVLTVVAAKIGFDGLGLLPDTSEMLGAPVLAAHHAYGVGAGLLLWLCTSARRRATPRLRGALA
jgi:rhomboid family GlyGly-CTERM serine protease